MVSIQVLFSLKGIYSILFINLRTKYTILLKSAANLRNCFYIRTKIHY